MANRDSNLNMTTVISALLGLLGGALSGGFAAYTQLSTSQEKFSIERATMFTGLIDKLQDEETSRMALLNLWQLYRDQRDQKIIIAAAFESGQPDLVETIIGLEDELIQLTQVLHAKANAGDLEALKTLTRIDPPSAAKVRLASVLDAIKFGGDRYIANDTVMELTVSARVNKEVANLIGAKTRNARIEPLLLEYILYNSGSNSNFLSRMLFGYDKQETIGLTNDFLAQANFKKVRRRKNI